MTAQDTYWDAVADVRYGYDDIEERFGVVPERMADFLALMGDAVDNIPGVPGVGRKTAATLLKHYHTLEGVYENLDAIPKLKFRGAAFVAQSLREHREAAYLSRRLTGIDCDMPIEAGSTRTCVDGRPTSGRSGRIRTPRNSDGCCGSGRASWPRVDR